MTVQSKVWWDESFVESASRWWSNRTRVDRDDYRQACRLWLLELGDRYQGAQLSACRWACAREYMRWNECSRRYNRRGRGIYRAKAAHLEPESGDRKALVAHWGDVSATWKASAQRTPEQAVETAELVEFAKRAIGKLGARSAEAVGTILTEEAPAQVAARRGVTQNNVQILRRRGILELRRLMRRHIGKVQQKGHA